jgi:hypothetical protein
MKDTGKMISVFGKAPYAVFRTGTRFCWLFLFFRQILPILEQKLAGRVGRIGGDENDRF